MSKSLSSILRGTNYGTLPISAGGTGGNTAATALTALGAQAILPAASGSVNGYLTSTDWTTFNSKLSSYTLPTAGASTLGGIKVGTGLTIDGNGILTTTNSGTVTSVAGTAPIASSGGATPTISIAAATTSVSGYLTSTDWNTFNSKQAALVSATNIKSINGTTLLGSGDLVISSGASATKTIANKTAAYTVVAGDLGKIINCTSGTFTISLTAAATLGAGFTCTIWNTSNTVTDAITIDPSGAETIDGLATLILRRGEGLDIVCDGTNWQIDDKKPMRGYAENFSNSVMRPVVTGSFAIGIGGNANATGTMGLALAYGAYATGDYSNGIGYQSYAGGNYSTAIGTNSGGNGSYALTGAGAMALGGSYASGTDSFAAGVGNNTSSYGALGANSIAFGQNAKAASASSVAAGSNAQAAGINAIAIGTSATSSSNSSVSVGVTAYAMGLGALAIGYQANANGNYDYANAIGFNSYVRGYSAVAIGNSYASGTDSFAAAIANNTSSYGARATGAIALGLQSSATGNGSIALGYNSATASGSNSLAIGYVCTANGHTSVAIGDGAHTKGVRGKFAFSPCSYSAFVSPGSIQSGKIVLVASTTTTTTVVLTSNTNAASTDNQLTVQSNQAMTFFGTLIAKQTASANMASYIIKGAIVNNAGTVTISSIAIETIVDTIGLTTQPTFTVDATNKALTVTSGAKLTTSIRWGCNLDTIEITYA
jgi:hypothetical protein